jgi:15-cis-phytoene synthase
VAGGATRCEVAGESGVTTDLSQAFEHCRLVCKREARNFYHGLRLSPEPQRSALFTVYAWMRAADDLVDDANGEDADDVRQHIEAFRAATDRALASEPDHGDPLWIAIAEVARRFRLAPQHVHAMLDGQLDDVAHVQYETFDDLYTYCYRVASIVGLICIEIWGYEDPAARELAVARGVAFQLTNIIRDYAQDFDAGRVYLPREDFQKHGLTPGELRQWASPEKCQAMMQQQIARAETFYQQSMPLDQMITPGCRPTLWAMTSIYHNLLRKMARDPSRIMNGRRVRLSALRKSAIALRAQLMAKMPMLSSRRHAHAALSQVVSGNSSSR